MLSESSREQRELPWQPNTGKKQNCTEFSCVQGIEEFIAEIVRFLGPANSNMLHKILGESRELPWQPNVSKNKQTLH